MKLLRVTILAMLMCLVASADTEYLGNDVYSNDDELINIVVDAGVAVRDPDSPYLMFMLYMFVDENVSATVERKDVALIHKDKEYEMPSVEELRKNYSGDIRDMRLYNSLIKSTLALSGIRFYRFPLFQDFFPTRNQATTAVDQGSMNNFIGFRTKVYFKNPGFKQGDVVVIKVKDKKDPEVYGAVAVEFKKD